MVKSRRGRSPEAVLDDYEQVSATGLERLAGTATLEMPVPLGDAGHLPGCDTAGRHLRWPVGLLRLGSG